MNVAAARCCHGTRGTWVGMASTAPSPGSCKRLMPRSLAVSNAAKLSPVDSASGPVAPITALINFPSEKLPFVRGFSEPAQFIFDRVLEDIVMPALVAILVVKLVDSLAEAASKAVDSHSKRGSAILGEVMLGLAPLALRGPAHVAVLVVLVTRLLRNSVWILDTYIHKFNPKFEAAADRLFHAACGLLGPLDNYLMHIYSAVLVGLVTAGLIRWKSIAVEWLIRHNAKEEQRRLLLPLDGLTSWVLSIMGGLFILQILGVNLQPIWAVGGAGSIIVGLATQQLLTNSVMGLNFFLSRPFVPGDSIELKAAGLQVAGTVDSVAPMRTQLRTDDDTVISIPNKSVAEMVIYNKTRTGGPRRTPAKTPLKLRLKVPTSELQQLPELRQAVLTVLLEAGPQLVKADKYAVVLGSFTDTGVDLIIKASLVGDPNSPQAQALMLRLLMVAKGAGMQLVSASTASN